MRTNISSKGLAIIIGIVGITSFLVFFIFWTPDVSVLATPMPIESVPDSIVAEQPRAGLPIRLKIPTIHVDAAIDSLGLTPEGLMDVPKGPGTTGWYELGPRPGEAGSAVIDGHFSWKNNLPAVFDNLSELQKGDKIFVEDDAGASIVFVVRDIQRYDPEADASEVFFSTDGKPHLNLITCGGAWNKKSKSFSQRLVVFADKE